MKKPILYAGLGLIALVVAAAAAAPMVIGGGVREATVDGMLDLLPPESRSQFQITELRFDRGWFGSTGEIDVRYVALAQQEDLALRLLFDISHGPLLFTPEGPRLGLAYARIVPSFNSAELSQVMAALPITLPELRLDMLAGLDESLRLALNIAPFNYGDASGQVSFAGLDGSVVANPDLSAELLLSMGALQAEQPATRMGFSFAGLELESTTRQLNDLLAPSMAMLAIPSISSVSPYPFTISDISADSRLQPSAAGPEKIDLHQGFRIANIESDIPVASMAVSMDVGEVHSELIRSYYRMAAEIQNAINSNPAPGSNPVEEFAETMATIAVQNSLVFGTLLEANAFDGDHSFHLRLDWRGLPDVSDLDSIDATQILEVFGFDLTLSLDEAAVMRSPLADMVAPYVQLGYLRVDSGRVMMDMSLSEAALTVNGETVPLAQFL